MAETEKCIVCDYEQNFEGDSCCRKCGILIWKRRHGDFATRIQENLSGILKKGIIVEQGTRALLFINGELAETLQPGVHEVGGLIEKLKHLESYRIATVVMVDVGDREIPFTILNVYTKDPLKIDITCKVVVQLENPSFFFSNVMKGRDRYPIDELEKFLEDELRNGFNEAIGRKSVVELNTDLDLKRQLEVSVEKHMRTTFQRTGVNLIQLRTLDYRLHRYGKIREMQQDAYLLISEEEAKLQQRKSLFDVYDRGELQAIFEETRELRYREERQKIWAEMRAFVNSDKMNEVKSGDELKAYLHEINKGELLREDEIEELKNTFAQRGLQRKFILDKIEKEQNIEKKKIEEIGEKLIELEKAKIDSEIDRIEIETADIARRKKIDTEIYRISELIRVGGVTAVIIHHDTTEEMRKYLVALETTKMMQGMTPEQILAIGAKDNPEIAKAFQERFKGLSAEMQAEFNEKIMQNKDKTIEIMLEMYTKALETQSEAVKGAAQGGRVTLSQPGSFGIYSGPVPTREKGA